ncbi:MAG: ABC transporter ATP-binding protein [Spirochaetales bacterium]
MQGSKPSEGMAFRPGRASGGPVYLGPKEKPKNIWMVLRRLYQYFIPQRFLLVLIVGCALGSSFTSFFAPYLIGRGIDVLASGTGKVDLERLGKILGFLLFLYGFGGISTFLQYYYMARLSQEVMYHLRQDLFKTYHTLPVSFFDQRPTGELMSRMVNDIDTINMTLSQGILQVLSSILILSGALGMMIYLSPLLTLGSLGVVPLGFLFTSLISSQTRKAFTRQQRELGALNAHIEETVSALWVVKAFTAEEKVKERFQAINRSLHRYGIQAQVLSGIVPPLMNLMNNLSFLITALIGGWLVLKYLLSIGTVASFLQYSRQFMRPINETANQWNLLQAAFAAAERVFELLDQPPEEKEIQEKELSTYKKLPIHTIKFRHVHFSYLPTIRVLSDVSFHAGKGQTIAIVGPTGAGKTTLVNLLARFYDVEAGSILLNERDIREIPRSVLRKNLGIVLQDTYLFADTLRENIRYGRLSATDEEVEEAARIAEADPFIRKLPEGYDTLLKDDGINLSQGERQLISLARALLADPPILILDEATSNVDTRTEVHIQRALERLRKGRISIIIAHRLSTIREADKILVLQGGKIVEWGSHQELMEAKGAYFALYHAQYRRQAELRTSHSLGDES